MCSKITIVVVEELVPLGALDPYEIDNQAYLFRGLSKENLWEAIVDW